MTKNLFNSIKTILPFLAIVGALILFTDCKSEVSSKKQQKAFHVDANGDLLNKKGDIVKKAGEFKLEGGFFVDGSGEPIKRDIDIAKEQLNKKMGTAKEKLNEKMGTAKDKLNAAADNTKGKLDAALDNTKAAVSSDAGTTTESVKANFNKVFNTKVVGTAFALSNIEFDKKSHRITNMSKAEIEGLVAALKEHPASRIQVQVHTADGKNKKECREISALRADVVKNMLVTLGVSADQISAKGLGLTTSDAAKAVANAVEVIVEE